MPLKPDTALAKDRRTGLSPMQHRHFSTIAAIIADMPANLPKRDIATHFADKLCETNPAFDYTRFIAACRKES